MDARGLLVQFNAAFETATRDSGEAFVRLKQGSPDWMSDVIREAHDHAQILPDDSRYVMIREVARGIEDLTDWDDRHEMIDALVDVTFHGLAQWLAADPARRMGHCDVACEEMGWPEAVDQILQYGQYREYEEIAGQLIQALTDKADAWEEETV